MTQVQFHLVPVLRSAPGVAEEDTGDKPTHVLSSWTPARDLPPLEVDAVTSTGEIWREFPDHPARWGPPSAPVDGGPDHPVKCGPPFCSVDRGQDHLARCGALTGSVDRAGVP